MSSVQDLSTVDVFFDQPIGQFVRWKVKSRSRVNPSTDLLVYKTPQNGGEEHRVRAGCSGIVVWITQMQQGDIIASGQILAQIKGQRVNAECLHPVIMKDLCAVCGKDLRKREGYPGEREGQVEAEISMVHSVPELMISSQAAKSLGEADERHLLDTHKLVLLVDLDQTLIHTTCDLVPKNLKDVLHFKMCTQGPWYHTRLRPRTRQFLVAVAQKYELHICTFGARLYAHKIAAFIDPSGHLFGHRILSRDECFDPFSKTANLKALFPCGDRLVCIIDDREDVWQHRQNVIHVKPYKYFRHTGDINAPPGFDKDERSDEMIQYELLTHQRKGVPDAEAAAAVDAQNELKENGDVLPESAAAEDSLSKYKDISKPINMFADDENAEQRSESSRAAEAESGLTAADAAPEAVQLSDSADEASDSAKEEQEEPSEVDDDTDDYLFYLEEILERLHKAFYQIYDQQLANGQGIPDMKCVVPYVKRKVLQEVRLVFTSVVPRNMPIEHSYLHRAAKAFGATVQDEIVPPGQQDSTTHLVVGKWGTSKVHLAQRYGAAIKIVSPQWLYASIERWEHVEEALFIVNRKNAKTMLPPLDIQNLHLFELSVGSAEVNAEGRKSWSRRNCDRQRQKNSRELSQNGKMSAENCGDQQSLLEMPASSACFTAQLDEADVAEMVAEVAEALSDEESGECEESNSSSESESAAPVAASATVELEEVVVISSSSDEDSLLAQIPRSWKRASPDLELSQTLPVTGCSAPSSKRICRRNEDVDDDDDLEEEELSGDSIGQSSDDESQSIGSVDDEMVEELEKYFPS